ncbi:MAG: tetratricopeptide repeat protein [bacterium]|nr:tetratricopeptide repeat protein [bacterium]
MNKSSRHTVIQSCLLILSIVLSTAEARAQNKDPKIDGFVVEIEAIPNADVSKKVTLAKKLITYSKSTNNYEGEVTGKDLLARFYYSRKEYDNCFRLYSEITNDSKKSSEATRTAREHYAQILSKAGLYESALEQKIIIREFLLKEKDYLPLSFTESSIALLHTKLENFDKAEFHYMEAIEAAKKWGKHYAIASIYNSVGVFYRNQNRPKRALDYFNKGLLILENQDALKYNDSVLLGYIKGNSGGVYYQLGNNDKAIENLNEDIKISKECKQYTSMINAAITLAKIYLNEKEYNGVIQTLDPIFKIGPLDDLEFSRIELHNLYYQAYSELNNKLKASEHFASYQKAWQDHDSLKEEIRLDIEHAYVANALRIQEERLSNEQQLHERKMTLVREREKFDRFRSTIIILSIIVLSIVVFVFLRRKIKNNKKDLALFSLRNELAKEKLRTIELEKANLSSEVRLKNKDLTDFAIDISRKHELLQYLKQEIGSLKTIPNEKVSEKVKDLLIYVNNQLIIDQNLIDFQNNIEKVNYEFFESLTEKYPSLTQTDRKIAGLIRLNLSNKEIAVIRGVSYKAAKISRYRLRKKMNLDEEDNIVEVLQSI